MTRAYNYFLSPLLNLCVHILHFLTHRSSHTHTFLHMAKLRVTYSHNCSLVTDQFGITGLLTASLCHTLSNTHTQHPRQASGGPLSGSLTVNASADVQSAQMKPDCTENSLTIDALLCWVLLPLVCSTFLLPLMRLWARYFLLIVTTHWLFYTPETFCENFLIPESYTYNCVRSIPITEPTNSK